jgi:serine/threonine protein kinase
MFVAFTIFQLFFNFSLARQVSGSLATILKNIESIEESLIRRWAKQILKGIEFLHNAGETFGNNLKVSNILLDFNSGIKLSDYVGGDLIATLVSGVDQEDTASKDSDLACFGLILYSMVTGRWEVTERPKWPSPSDLVSVGMRDGSLCCIFFYVIGFTEFIYIFIFYLQFTTLILYFYVCFRVK